MRASHKRGMWKDHPCLWRVYIFRIPPVFLSSRHLCIHSAHFCAVFRISVQGTRPSLIFHPPFRICAFVLRKYFALKVYRGVTLREGREFCETDFFHYFFSTLIFRILSVLFRRSFVELENRDVHFCKVKRTAVPRITISLLKFRQSILKAAQKRRETNERITVCEFASNFFRMVRFWI